MPTTLVKIIPTIMGGDFPTLVQIGLDKETLLAKEIIIDAKSAILLKMNRVKRCLFII